MQINEPLKKWICKFGVCNECESAVFVTYGYLFFNLNQEIEFPVYSGEEVAWWCSNMECINFDFPSYSDNLEPPDWLRVTNKNFKQLKGNIESE
jgi:hypothetical protein